jgi:hypothetical protein
MNPLYFHYHLYLRSRIAKTNPIARRIPPPASNKDMRNCDSPKYGPKNSAPKSNSAPTTTKTMLLLMTICLLLHVSHIHTSRLHQPITNGSQQNGVKRSNNTTKSIHPTNDNPFLCGNNTASRPQNGHCGVNGILSPLTCSLRLKMKLSEHYQNKAPSVNGVYSEVVINRCRRLASFAALPGNYSALSICALCSLSE